MQVEDKYIYTTANESAREKDWAAGPKILTKTAEFVVTTTLKPSVETVTYAPAWYKCVDELVVNAIDHAIRCKMSTGPKVTEIKISISPEGAITVENDGPGIETDIHKVASKALKKEIRVPEFIMGHLFQGSNRTKENYPDTIIGGTNGIGAKLANLYSVEFNLETVHGGHVYTQQWTNGMKDCSPPVIESKSGRTYTKIMFRPDYAYFGYQTNNGRIDRAIASELSNVIRNRAFMAAAYVGRAVPGVTIYFNGRPVTIHSIIDYARLASSNIIATTTLAINTADGHKTPYRWEVVVAKRGPKQPAAISVINGIVVTDGTHIRALFKQIIDNAKAEVFRRIKTADVPLHSTVIKNEITLYINGAVPNPGWSGQRKDVLSMDQRKWAIPTVPADFISAIADAVHEKIVNSILHTQKQQPSKGKRVEGYDVDKYQKAELLGPASSLIMIEGDSAMTHVKTAAASTIGFRRYGFISLGGVIINARRETKIVPGTEKPQFLLSTKIQQNKLMAALKEFVGLVPGRHYDTVQERARLKYGCVIACVDQDHDGVGQIFGLVLNMFERFWPHLLSAGFVKRFETPRLRAFPKTSGMVYSFYTDAEYIEWRNSVSDPTKYKIKYYKGLGTHTRDQMLSMFKGFESRLYTYRYDESAPRQFEVYYGSDPSLRRKALSRPPVLPDEGKIASQEAEMAIDCSDHLQYETHLYQCDSILRHLVSAMDGMSQGGRLIFHGSQRAWRGPRDEMKVAQLGGFISEHENYLHGEDSLYKSITGKAFIAPGGRQIPQLIPFGNFGSRAQGGKDAGSPRYIYTKLNSRAMDLIYPAADYPLLEFEYDEGVRGAPKYYCPVIPTSILESVDMPGHGWRITIWARDALKVIELVRSLIVAGTAEHVSEPPPDTHGWTGTIKNIRGIPYSYGRYTLVEVKGDGQNDDDEDGLVTNKARRVIIHELPLQIWTSDFIAEISKKKDFDEMIADVMNRCAGDKVEIEYVLQPGALEKMEADLIYTDRIEEWFKLRANMRSRLNLIGVDSAVIEFEKYSDIIKYWYGHRRDLYSVRVDRDIAILKMRIRAYEAKHRYLTTGPRLRDKSEEEMCEWLVANDYPRISWGRIRDPGFLTAAELEDVFDGADATFDWALNSRDRDRAVGNISKLAAQIAALKEQLAALIDRANLGAFRGAQIWLDELDAIESVIKEGRVTEWSFGDAGRYVYETPSTGPKKSGSRVKK